MIALGTGRTPIGLDLGTRMIRAAQLDRSGKPLATARLLRNHPGDAHGPEDFMRLRGVLYRSGFRGRELIIAAPKSIIQRTSIDLPPRESGAPLEEIARSELARQTHLDPASFEFDWWDAPQPPKHGSSIRAITVSCGHDNANALLDAVEQAGLIPLALLSPSAASAAAAPPPEPGALVGSLDLGWSDATLVVRTATKIVFERRLSGCGLSRAFNAVVGKHKIDPGRLARIAVRDRQDGFPPPPAVIELHEHYLHNVRDEVRSSIDYLRNCEGSHEPALLTVLGGGAGIPGVADAIAQASEIAARLAPGLHGPEMAAALALAAPRGRYTIGEAA
ncbi:MAG: hypothetical protein K8E66_06300 [Phycisphaerales bacterium]|nr:hypothetical protein [Phycisphaerales bacterium]